MATDTEKSSRFSGLAEIIPDPGGLLPGRSNEARPKQAALVDGAEILFIDPQAKHRTLEEHDLVIVTDDSYPEPGILRCRRELNLPEGAAIVSAGASSLLRIGGSRVIVRQFTLAPPERKSELNPRDAELIPDAIDGETIPPTDQHADLVATITEAVKDEDQRPPL